MHIAQLRLHPTDASFVVLVVGSDANPILGRFEPARLSKEHGGYLIHSSHVDALGRFLAIHDFVIADERQRDTPQPLQYHPGQPAVLKCGACGYTQRYGDQCNDCHTEAMRPHIITPEEQVDINRRGRAKVQAEWRGLKSPDEA